MANMSLEKIKMPEQAPDIRNQNFEEVAIGYTAEMAIEEATRCLNCKHKPCVSGCPVNVQIPEFIAEVAKGDFLAAYQIITSTNALPAVCVLWWPCPLPGSRSRQARLLLLTVSCFLGSFLVFIICMLVLQISLFLVLCLGLVLPS